MNNQHNNDMILFDYNQNSTNANFLDNLHIPNIVKVTSPFRLTVKEYGTITGSLWQRLDSCASLLCGVSDGCNADSNLLRITALVIS